MEKKCSICGNEANIVYVDSNGKNYCKSCKATYICSGCGKPYEVEGIDNFICNKCGFSTG